IESASSNDEGNYKFPPIELLIAPTLQKNNENKEDVLKEKADKLEKTLHDFKVDAKVTNVTQGPAVTRYEVQPSTGVKVSSIVKLSDDIALNMEARSIRIEAPIPGKPAVGIEIENESIKMIRLREILDSKEFKEAKSKISFAVGKDIEGNCLVADLKSMPHMLIAGSTGSGKSVCINSIIISLIYKSKPSEVKLLLIDPKVVELGIYNSIPHMMIPVVTEPSKAAAALNWAVCEMNERYKKFASNGVRDLESYNKTMREKELFAEVLPQIVIIIDELADLMMASPSQVEDSICRLAQMARAAGMHLIVATQRPSVDVVTGVIKANIPSRIAFAVSSQFDSRTILDMAGAEKLVGKGDMLFAPMGSNKPTRVQGNFITDEEVNAVVDFFKEQGTQTETTEASKSLLASMEENSAGNEITSDFEDELMSEAIEAVLKAEQASVSMLQRRFRIGYNRAARIIDEMEKLGIIGEADGSRPRIVNFTYEEYFSNLENSIAEEKEEKEETEE
ncbi:MAG: DNA translocase FtsK, partial [Eubacteriales bacterium]